MICHSKCAIGSSTLSCYGKQRTGTRLWVAIRNNDEDICLDIRMELGGGGGGGEGNEWKWRV